MPAGVTCAIAGADMPRRRNEVVGVRPDGAGPTRRQLRAVAGLAGSVPAARGSTEHHLASQPECWSATSTRVDESRPQSDTEAGCPQDRLAGFIVDGIALAALSAELHGSGQLLPNSQLGLRVISATTDA
jgi:hypothetical protein